MKRITRRALLVLTLAGVFTTLPAATSHAQSQDTILNRVLRYNAQTGEFDTLIAAVLCADPALIDVLDGGAALTVFLPTDAAFAQLGLDPQTVCELDQETLTDILLYHVTPGLRSLHSLTNERLVEMANGLDTEFFVQYYQHKKRWYPRVFINDAQILNHAVPVYRGYIFVINQVLLPFTPAS
jgi:uncharacterized surface protein with fasciclin (FAS1) repeats